MFRASLNGKSMSYRYFKMDTLRKPVIGDVFQCLNSIYPKIWSMHLVENSMLQKLNGKLCFKVSGIAQNLQNSVMHEHHFFSYLRFFRSIHTKLNSLQAAACFTFLNKWNFDVEKRRFLQKNRPLKLFIFQVITL